MILVPAVLDITVLALTQEDHPTIPEKPETGASPRVLASSSPQVAAPVNKKPIEDITAPQSSRMLCTQTVNYSNGS